MKISFAILLIFLFGRKVLCLPVNASCTDVLSTSFNTSIVLAFDVSASMELQDRLMKVTSTAIDWIVNEVPCATQLAIVQFSWRAEILSHLIIINEESRMELVKKIPTLAQGETCVPCGLKEAAKVLGDSNAKNASSVIVIIMDSDDSELDLDDEFIQSMKALGIHVVVVVLSDKEHKLKNIEKLTLLTNGFSRYVRDDNIYKDLMATLINVQNLDFDNLPTKFPETTEEVTINNSTLLNDAATLEPEIEVESTTVFSSPTKLPETTEEINKSTSAATTSFNNISHAETIPVENVTISHIPTNETTEFVPVQTVSPLFYLGVSALLVFIVVAIISISWWLCCRKQHAQPCGNKGSYQPQSKNICRYDHVRRTEVANNDLDRYG